MTNIAKLRSGEAVFSALYETAVGIDVHEKKMVALGCGQKVGLDLFWGADKKLDLIYSIIPKDCRYCIGLLYPKLAFILHSLYQ